MKKLASFLVKKRWIMLILMLILTIVSGFLIPQVQVNDDMTKYLADDSNMKQGIDIMSEEFADLESTNEIRVMFTGLSENEKEPVADTLKNMDYVDSVSYEIDEEDYNKGEYTLYCINTKYDFGSEEESDILENIDDSFEGYTFVCEETNNTRANLPVWIIIAALTIMMIILFAMSGSWVEPILFVITIGCAIVLNMGTNVFKGMVSQTTYTIAAILQLVLSMDYSIIIMNRYRQELPLSKTPAEAMEHTLSNAFMSVTSSALTTFVGLLMLVFMSFKIGPDLGIVLAKGVVFSLLCVFTILPCLILIFHKAIMKSAKPVLPIPSGGLAKLSYKGRIPLTLIFVFLLLGTYFLQTQTGISFASTSQSAISEIFPATNTVVLLYNNDDEASVETIADALEEDEKVTSVYSYPTMLGKQYKSDELLDTVADMGSDMEIEPYMLALMYYRYYQGDDLPAIKVADLLNFIADEVVTNETFSEYMNSDIKDNIAKMKKFADPSTLTKKMTVQELADFFEMDSDNLSKMFILYYKDRDDAGTSKLTVAEFVKFLQNDILTDDTYAAMIDADMAAQIDTFAIFADKATITKTLSYTDAAKLLSMDADQLKLLYMYYYAQQEDYTPSAMTLPEFVNFLQNTVLTNSTFSGQIDSTSTAQLTKMAAFTDTTAIQTPLSSEQMAAFMTMDVSQVESIYQMYFGEENVENTTMTMNQFLEYLLANDTITAQMDTSTLQQLQTMNTLLVAATSEKKFTAAELSGVLSMDKQTIASLISMYGMMHGDSTVTTVSLPDFMDFFVNTVMQNPQYASMFDDTVKEQLVQMNQMMQLAMSGQTFSYAQMAGMLGIEKNNVRQIYVLYAGSNVQNKTMSPYKMLVYLMGNSVITAQMDASDVSSLQMLKSIMDLSLSGQKLGYAEMAMMMSMDASSIKTLYTLHDSYGDTSAWKLSLQQVIGFISGNQNLFGSSLGDYADKLSLMQKIMDGVVNGTTYSYKELADLLGMDATDLKQMYLLHQSKYGDTSSWGMSPQQFVKFIQEKVLTNSDYADAIDADSASYLDTAEILIDAVVSEKTYTVAGAYELLKGLTDSMSENDLTLLYTYYGSQYDYDNSWTMSIEELFRFLNEDLLEDPVFADLIDEQMKNDVRDIKDELDEAVHSLKGKHYSLMSISTTYDAESDATFAFLENLHTISDEKLAKDHYFIGSSAMYYEMSQNFKSEMLMMTLLTAISIFIIVLISFKSLAIPTLLVLLVQTAVFATVSVSFVRGYAINYLAYLIVQCILMGATIDYAILFTNNYRESRRTSDVRESLVKAYAASMHTILTSGMIMILVTGILGFAVSDPNIGPICQTISIGTLAAVILIIFVLPSMLAVFDRFVCRRKRS